MYIARIESEWEQTARISFVVQKSMGGNMAEHEFMPNFRGGKRKTPSIRLDPEQSMKALEKVFASG